MPHSLNIIFCIIAMQVSSIIIACKASAVTYPAPELSKLMFHMDKISLDPGRISRISDDLTLLAKQPHNDKQSRLDTSAKLLALALRLNPENSDAIRLNQQFLEQSTVQQADIQLTIKALQQTQNVVVALSKFENNSEVDLFVSYLKDALTGVAPKNLHLQNHTVSSKRWKNVLKEIKQKKLPVKPLPPTHTKPDEGSLANKEDPDNAEPPIKQPSKDTASDPVKWNQLTSEVSVPIYLIEDLDDKDSIALELASFKTTIKPSTDDKTGKITLEISPKSPAIRPFETQGRLRDNLSSKWKLFPSAQVSVELPEIYSRKNNELGFFPLLFQLHTSLKNIEIKEGINLIGKLDPQGNLKRNHQTWTQLKQLRKQDSYKQTLIAPLNTEKDFLQLIALEEAEFFIRNEVLLAKNIDEAVQYAGEINDENLKTAHEQFVRIRDLVGTKSVGSYSVNKKIRSMLEGILELNPNHLSAKMILLRGDTKRSSKLESYYLAEEFKPLLKSLLEIKENRPDYYDIVESLNEKSLAIDEAIEPLKRYVDSDDEELIDALEKMSSELNNISRALKRKHDSYSESSKRSAKSAYDRFTEYYNIAKQFIQKAQKRQRFQEQDGDDE